MAKDATLCFACQAAPRGGCNQHCAYCATCCTSYNQKEHPDGQAQQE